MPHTVTTQLVLRLIYDNQCDFFPKMVGFPVVNNSVKTPLGHSQPSAYGFGNACASSGKLCTGVAKIWLFGPHSACSLIQPKLFAFFYIYFIAKVLCCFSIRIEEIHLTALKDFQVSKALGIATEKIPLNVPNHRFETWSLHTSRMLDSWLNISVDYFTRR